MKGSDVAELILKVTYTKGEGKGSPEPAQIADTIATELLDGQSVFVENDDGDEREFTIDSAERVVE